MKNTERASATLKRKVRLIEMDIDNLACKFDTISLPKVQGRTISTHQTLRKIYKLKHKIGVTRLNYISDFENLGIPVFSVTRPNVHSNQRNCSTQGKGLTVAEAAVSALMEAFEHQAANDYNKIITFSIQNLVRLGLPYLDPRSLGGICENEDVIEWVDGINLFDSGGIYLPAIVSLFPYIPSQRAVTPTFQTYPSTTGLASGNTKLDAILHACFELIEREGLSEFISGNRFRVISTDEIFKNVRLAKIFRRFEQNQIQFCALQLYSHINLPITFVSLISSNPIAPPIVVTGHSCRLTLQESLVCSFAEAVQVYNAVIQSSREDLIRHNDLWQCSYKETFEKWHQSKDILISLSSFIQCKEYLEDSSILERVKIICLHLTKAGYDQAYFVDLTNNELQVPVTKVIIPKVRDLAHNFFYKRPDLFYLKNWFIGV